MEELFKAVGGIFMGPGAFGDPKETFKLYAPPTLLDVYTPEQQELYGKQIQAQMRRINADYRPSYKDIQGGIVDAGKNAQAMKMQQQTLSDMQRIFGGDPNVPTPAMPGAQPAAAQPAMPAEGAAPSPTTAPVANSRAAQATKYFKAAQYYGMRGDSEGAKRYLDMGLALHPNPSEAIRDLEYLGFNMAGAGDDGFGRLKQLHDSKSNKVNVSTGISKGEEAYWSTLGKNLPELESQAMAASRTNESLQGLIDLSGKKTFSGTLAPGAVGATQFLSSFGVNVKPETLANTREFQANANILVLDFMGAMGGARGFSKEESAILYDAFPKIIDSPQARERIARMLIARNNRIIRDYNTMRGQFEQGIGKPLASPRISPMESAAPTQEGGAAVKTYDPKTGTFK